MATEHTHHSSVLLALPFMPGGREMPCLGACHHAMRRGKGGRLPRPVGMPGRALRSVVDEVGIGPVSVRV